MEKGESKVAIVETQSRSEASSRLLGSLAGAVALLALSFIVLIACGTVVLNNNTCETQQQVSSADVTQRYDLEYQAEEKTYMENVVMHPGRRMEYIVIRDVETGLVESVLTVDYNAKTTTMYSAKLNVCFMRREETRDFDDVVRELQEEGKVSDKTGQRKTVDFILGDRVKNVNNIPMEMSAFCTTTNTRWIEERSEHERTRRQDLRRCVYSCVSGGVVFDIGGVRYYELWCILCDTCVNCPCTMGFIVQCITGYYNYNETRVN